MKSQLGKIGLCLVGILVGCAGASVAPVAWTRAQSGSGSWRCFATDLMEDLNDAADWRGAWTVTRGLNSAAAHTPSGTVVNIQWNQATSVTCVKY